MAIQSPGRLTLGNHIAVLEWLSTPQPLLLDFAAIENVHVWALVALAALNEASDEDSVDVEVRSAATSAPSRFAHAVGFDEMIGGSAPHVPVQSARTVRLQRVRRFEEVESVSRDISHLVISDPQDDDTRRTLYYILVEFLRNAVQHSHHAAGAVVGAQLMDKTSEYETRPVVQVAVADVGLGVMKTLQATYPELRDAHHALTMAQQPWVSSQFERGGRGGARNAGLGLFFVAELAKRTAGRFLIVSRGGGLLLQGDSNFEQHHHIQDERFGYPGTLVVFELPIGEIEDYEGLIEVVQDTAMRRMPKQTRIHVICFESSTDPRVLRVAVRYGAEDTGNAERLVNDHLLPRIERGEAFELDFSGLRVCTQSFLHALLFVPLRAARANGTKIFVANCTDAIKGSLQFLESYALSE